MVKLRIAYMNICERSDWKSNVLATQESIIKAAKKRADIVLFPEGFPLMNRDHVGVDRGIKKIAKTAKENKIVAIIGSQTPDWIGAHVLANGKEFGRQYKLNAFANNPRKIIPKDVEIFKFKKSKYGVPICYSLFFPETAQLYRLKKADFLLFPLLAFYGKNKWSNFWKSLVPMRSYESGLPIVSSGLISKRQKSDGIGMVAYPNFDQKILTFGKEEMAVAEIDINKWRKYRKKKSNANVSGLFHILNKEHGFPIGDKNWHILKKYIEYQLKEIKTKKR